MVKYIVHVPERIDCPVCKEELSKTWTTKEGPFPSGIGKYWEVRSFSQVCKNCGSELTCTQKVFPKMGLGNYEGTITHISRETIKKYLEDKDVK